MEKIYYQLHTGSIPTLTAQYAGCTEKTAIHLVPTVMDAHMGGKPLLFEEEVALAEKYLNNLLTDVTGISPTR